MSDNSFSIGERQFKLSKINAMKQFHIVRRIAPILSEMVPVMRQIANSPDEASDEVKMDFAVQIAGPIMGGLSKLSDKDAEFVLFTLLQSVEMKQEVNWARLSNGDMLLFDNLDMPVLLNAAGRALMYNLSGFFDVLQRTS